MTDWFYDCLLLNVHIHSQVSDGVYARLPDERLCFLRVPSPTDADIKMMTVKIANRVHRYLEKRISETDCNALEEKEPLLAKCYAASIRSLNAVGINAGKPLLRLVSPEFVKEHDDRTILGFNLHASKPIDADNREGLERILRYMGRPPLSHERLKMAPDGERLLLTLKSVWKDGTEKILLTPFNLLERLVAIIPQPRKNQIRYHGFFAPNAHLRKEIIENKGELGHKVSDKKICRPDFARLMARVFAIDVLVCPRCESRMQLISHVQDPQATRDILLSLKMATAPPSISEPNVRVMEYDSDSARYFEEEEDAPTEF